MPGLVNGQSKSLTTINHGKSSGKADAVQLIETMFRNGAEGNINNVIASLIGLPHAMPMKKQEILIEENGTDFDKHAYFLAYENAAAPGAEAGNKRTVCVYLIRGKRLGLDIQHQYFRIDLAGKLVKAILSKSKSEASGKVVRGSGVKFDQDIDSPEVRKAFEAAPRCPGKLRSVT